MRSCRHCTLAFVVCGKCTDCGVCVCRPPPKAKEVNVVGFVVHPGLCVRVCAYVHVQFPEAVRSELRAVTGFAMRMDPGLRGTIGSVSDVHSSHTLQFLSSLDVEPDWCRRWCTALFSRTHRSSIVSSPCSVCFVCVCVCSVFVPSALSFPTAVRCRSPGGHAGLFPPVLRSVGKDLTKRLEDDGKKPQLSGNANAACHRFTVIQITGRTATFYAHIFLLVLANVETAVRVFQITQRS